MFQTKRKRNIFDWDKKDRDEILTTILNATPAQMSSWFRNLSLSEQSGLRNIGYDWQTLVYEQYPKIWNNIDPCSFYIYVKLNRTDKNFFDLQIARNNHCRAVVTYDANKRIITYPNPGFIEDTPAMMNAVAVHIESDYKYQLANMRKAQKVCFTINDILDARPEIKDLYTMANAIPGCFESVIDDMSKENVKTGSLVQGLTYFNKDFVINFGSQDDSLKLFAPFEEKALREIENILFKSELKHYLKFFDIPRQYFNCPMKWGAVGGYLKNGDPEHPHVIEHVDYFGASGGKAVKVFGRDVKYYDIEVQTIPQICKDFDKTQRRYIMSYFPVIIKKSIFEYYQDDRIMVSDAWSKEWGDVELDVLFSKVTNMSVVKFSCDFDVLAGVLYRNIQHDTIYLLNFGRPASTEVFLTKIPPTKPHYLIRPVVRESIGIVLFSIRRNKVFDMVEYINYLRTPFSDAIPAGRPFKIETWMWPLILYPIGSYNRQKKSLNYMDIDQYSYDKVQLRFIYDKYFKDMSYKYDYALNVG